MASNQFPLGAIVYYISLPFIYLLSLLPFPLLYLFSDMVYLILFRIAGYRTKVVRQNLRNSFPGKTDREINVIMKDFYHFLCDIFIETFKTLTISKDAMLKHCRVSTSSLALLDGLAAEKKNVILVMGHYGNWEWGGNAFSLMCKHQLYVIYHPLANKHFDGLMYRMRTRFGAKLIPMKDTFREMLRNRGELNATAFIADQTPSYQNAHWMTFLNQETPVFKGAEIIARKMNTTLVYTSVHRLKRGYYEIRMELLNDNPAATVDGQISEMHTHRLEQDIIADPAVWLWSHRRWKHKREQPQ